MKSAFFLGFLSLSTICQAAPVDSTPSSQPSKEVYLRIADETEANLRTEILQRFFPAAADEKGGGFFENYGLDWRRGEGGNKSIVYQSRLTWTSAQAAERFPGDAAMYVAMNRRGVACLAEQLWDKNGGGFFWGVGPNGLTIDNAKQIYGHAFGVYASAASYQVTHDPAALDLAKKGFQWLEQHAHDDQNQGYFETIGPDGKPSSLGAVSVGAAAEQKSMNSSIHLLEALTELYKVWPDPAVKLRVAEMLSICRDKIFSEPGYLTLFLTRDWRRTTCPDSFGHDVETAYLMTEAAEALGQGDDPRTWTAAQHLVDHALQYGWDTDRGGLYDSAAIGADGVVIGDVHTDKIWWVEAEHLNALLLMHERFGNRTPRYWQAFVKQWDWITKHQVDPIHGGWWHTVHADGSPASQVKADKWTECYHQARAMLTVSARLRKMAEAER